MTVANVRRSGYPIAWANHAFEQLTGWSADEVEGRDCRFFLNEDDPAAARGLSLALDHGRGFRGAIPARRRDGSSWLSEVTVTPLRDKNGDLSHCVLVHEDVTVPAPADPTRARARKETPGSPKRALSVEGDLARQVLDALEDGVILYDSDANIMAANDSALRMFGVREDEVIGRATAELPFSLFFEDGTPLTLENSPARRTLVSGEPARDVILRLEHGDDSAWLAANFHPLDFDGDNGATAVVASIADITERRHAEQQIAFLAYHDSLTELPNRTLLAEHLEQGLARARRYGRAVALLYIDLDGFKLVNDSFGHAAGDELLTRIATRLREGTRSADLLARQGGDEFLLLLTDIEGDAAAVAERAAETIRHALEAPFVLRGAEVQVGASVGVGLFPRDAQSARGLLLFADQAMYKAKGGREARGAPALPTDPLERLALTTRLRNALAAGEFVLHWQPIMELEGGDIVSLEALLRWEDQERGLIPAAEFIPIAEEMGLIEQIDAWVVDAIARQARAWSDDGLAPRLSFNVSAHDLRRPGTLAAMAARLAGSDLDASLFTVEVDESGALDSRGQLAPALRDLHAAGIGIAIDRFGSGLSALARLREMPLSALKIDGAFVARAPDDEATASLVDGILGFAGALGVAAIAEHVETEEQRRFLIDHGCRAGQGFHLARPAGTAETTALLYRDRESG